MPSSPATNSSSLSSSAPARRSSISRGRPQLKVWMRADERAIVQWFSLRSCPLCRADTTYDDDDGVRAVCCRRFIVTLCCSNGAGDWSWSDVELRGVALTVMRSVITTEAMATSRSCRCQAVKATAMSATRMSAPGCYRTVKVTRWAPPSRRYGQPRSCEVCAAVLLCAVCCVLCGFCFLSPYVAGRRSIYALLCDDASQARSVVCCTVEATCSRCGRYARF